MKLNYLPINKSKTRTDSFIIELDGNNYIFEFYYNPIGKHFTFNMHDIDENAIVLGAKIVYNFDMLGNIVDDRLPNVIIMPADPSAQDQKITYENFMDSVKCYIFAGDN